jgi:ribosomal-protein-alanine N-acetyltransferase
MSLTLRYMQLLDIAQVVAIDQQSFNPPWSARSYEYEIRESHYSHMVVLEQADSPPSLSLVQRWFGNGAKTAHRIVAYGGLWNIADEAHISTIASHPQMRGRGLGEVVLAGMIAKAIHNRAAYVVLEVRVSNTSAQNLYHKYAFTIVDTKKGYYHNNGEDAYDMRLNLTDPQTVSAFQARHAALRQRVPHIDQYSTAERMR